MLLENVRLLLETELIEMQMTPSMVRFASTEMTRPLGLIQV